jgi:Spy/CpxP family protein refolding chaperone
MKILNLPIAKLALCLSLMSTGSPALCDESFCVIQWGKLGLTVQQKQAVERLESEWEQIYMQIQPSIVDEQRRLQQMMGDSGSNPIEIMQLKQSVSRKQQQLSEAAMANHLKKLQVLNDNQRKQVNDQVQQFIDRRQNSNSPGGVPESLMRMFTGGH